MVEELQGTETLVNTGELWPDPDGAWLRVRRMQTKLHRWAVDDPDRRFDDLFNLVHHPDFLTIAWERVRGNKGARTAGVDRVIPAFIADDADIVDFLRNAREQLKTRTFTPLPARERMIPKPGSDLHPTELAFNTGLSKIRSAVEHAIAHLKTWRIISEEGGRYRAPVEKYPSLLKAVVGLFFFAAYG